MSAVAADRCPDQFFYLGTILRKHMQEGILHVNTALCTTGSVFSILSII
jgi:hypothetical protein